MAKVMHSVGFLGLYGFLCFVASLGSVCAQEMNVPVMHDARFPVAFHENGKLKAQILAKKATMPLREEGTIVGEGVIAELYTPEGELDARIISDKCTYYKYDHAIMSVAPLQMERPGMKLTGKGFKWRIDRELCEILHDARVVFAREEGTSGVVTSSVIAAESAIFDYGNGMVTFKDDVVVVDPMVMMRADTLIIEMEGTNDLKTVAAHGNVRVMEEGMRARSSKAIYEKKKGTLRLMNDVRVVSGDDYLAGDRITVFLDEKRLVSKPGYIAVYPGKDGEEKSRPSWFMQRGKRGS